MKTPYEILGVTPDVTSEELLLAYRVACMRTHPDRGGTVEDFVAVKKAYKSLAARVCPHCGGTGFVTTYRGAFVDKTPCKQCWKLS